MAVYLSACFGVLLPPEVLRLPLCRNLWSLCTFQDKMETVNSKMTGVLSHFQNTFSCVLSYLYVLRVPRWQEAAAQAAKTSGKWITLAFICWQSCQDIGQRVPLFYVLQRSSYKRCHAVSAPCRAESPNPFQSNAALLILRHAAVQDCPSPYWGLSLFSFQPSVNEYKTRRVWSFLNHIRGSSGFSVALIWMC